MEILFASSKYELIEDVAHAADGYAASSIDDASSSAIGTNLALLLSCHGPRKLVEL